MGNGKKSKNNFIIQGGILAIASLLSRVIGLLYRIPLTNIIGDEGNGDYTPDSQKRLMVAIDDVYGTGIDQDGTQTNFRNLQWGLFYSNGGNASIEVP